MIVVRDEQNAEQLRGGSVAAIGVFDGMHRGHHEVIANVKAFARELGAATTVITFDPSPAMYFAPTKAPRLVNALSQRLEALNDLGIDQVVVLTFNETLANESAGDFIERVLVNELDVRGVVVGDDFHFGHNREGNVDLLKEVGKKAGFEVHATPPQGEGERFSSTRVRASLASGDMDIVGGILGRPFVLRGDVIHGDQRGTGLGFPTANLSLPGVQQLPREGVYAGATKFDGQWYAAAISVGTRPQFYVDGELLVEVFVVDFSGDLYDATLDVTFLARLRDQETFASPVGLSAQIEDDVAKTREIFANFRAKEG